MASGGSARVSSPGLGLAAVHAGDTMILRLDRTRQTAATLTQSGANCGTRRKTADLCSSWHWLQHPLRCGQDENPSQ